MNPLPNQLHYILRFSCAMCFIGHGAFGIITKPIWCNYFAVFGIGEHLAYQLMPVIGVADVIFGISLIVYPVRAVAVWLVFWGLFTALLRPLSGEPFAEFIERAGNFGAPLVLLLLSGTNGVRTTPWFKKINPEMQITKFTVEGLAKYLQFFAFLLLLGHGWLNLLEKKGLLNQYVGLGWGSPVQLAHLVGVFEILGALLILFKPVRPLILTLFIWKMMSELLYPHHELLEWIERGGSYGALLALWLLLGTRDSPAKALSTEPDSESFNYKTEFTNQSPG